MHQEGNGRWWTPPACQPGILKPHWDCLSGPQCARVNLWECLGCLQEFAQELDPLDSVYVTIYCLFLVNEGSNSNNEIQPFSWAGWINSEVTCLRSKTKSLHLVLPSMTICDKCQHVFPCLETNTCCQKCHSLKPGLSQPEMQVIHVSNSFYSLTTSKSTINLNNDNSSNHSVLRVD